MLLVNNQANSSVRPEARTSSPTTRLNAEEYCSAASWLVSAICWAIAASHGNYTAAVKGRVGVLVAAQLLVSWSHPGRCRSEAAFARLAGVAPLPATSGQTQTRHRLSRGGDRQLNRVIHTAVLTRVKTDAGTRDYLARRVAQGKTKREAMRCLKRYYARHLFRLLEAAPMTT